MRKVLLVYLKDTFYAGSPGAAQWHYAQADADELLVHVLGSGSLRVSRENPESALDESGKRLEIVAFFPAGGWSGYSWEPIDDGRLAVATAQAAGIAVAR